MILALDCATRCGWYIDTPKFVTGGTWDLSTAGKRRGAKLAKFEQSLCVTIETWRPDCIAFEESTYGANSRSGGVQWASLIMLAMLRGIVELTGEKLGIPTIPIPIATAKSYATGKGNAKKQEVMRWFELTHKCKPADDNHADAWAVHCAARQRPEVRAILNQAIYSANTKG